MSQHAKHLVAIAHCLNMPLLVGLPATQTKRLQNMMNSAARLISGVRKFELITPTLKELHWLHQPNQCGPEHLEGDFISVII